MLNIKTLQIKQKSFGNFNLIFSLEVTFDKKLFGRIFLQKILIFIKINKNSLDQKNKNHK
jgi:hypothetical protein